MKIVSKLILRSCVASLLAVAPAILASSSAPSVSADAALAKLKEGNQRFVGQDVSAGKPNAERRKETARGQHPSAIIVACADSRTAPELVFDGNIGELFVIRTAGNLVDDYALGSIEYAVEHLGTRLIVVLGHERCGAVTAAMGSDHAPGHIGSLVRDIQPAVQAAKGAAGEPLDATIAENARLVAAKIKANAALGHLAAEVKIVPAVYDLDSGQVEWAKH